MRLLLFDIDATLISTGGVGIRAMEAAGRELFGPGFSSAGVDYAGRLDPLIVRDLLAANGRPATPANAANLRCAYGHHLREQLPRTASARSLPGVLQLLDLLEPRATLGLLTGNYADTGAIKLRACGIDPARFPIAAWGDDSPHDPPDRSHLPPVALDRYRARFGRDADPARCAIIGDTPHDVRCAKVNGLRALAVATGMFSADVLRQAGADLVLPDLSDAAAAADWLLSA